MKVILERLVKNYPELKNVVQGIMEAYDLLIHCYNHKGKVMLCGNGGSAADCEHIAGELLKGFMAKRQLPDNVREELIKQGADESFPDNLQGALPAISLVGQNAFSTAFLNDMNPDFVFAQMVYGLGVQGDVLIGITTSGNSDNVRNAAIVARQKGIKVIGLTGKDGGKLKKFCDVLINAPAEETYRVQEYHIPIYHAICEMVEKYYWEL